jgi:subtilisin-like proprotein convertase family protein
MARRLAVVLGVSILGLATAVPALEAGTRGRGTDIAFRNETRLVIPDASFGGGKLSKIVVDRGGTIDEVEVGVRINHQSVDDLNIYLISPQGRFVELSTDNGGEGNNYGTGPNSCGGGGSFAIFDDDAGRSIASRSAPFAGPSRPQTPLGRLDGRSIRGTWRLQVFDDQDGVRGTIGCFAIGFGIR